MGIKTTTTCGDHGDDHDLPLLLPDVYFFIQEILVRLPVKSLLRFKSVSKSWLSFIQTSFFIDLHTTFINSSSSSSKFGDTFILQTTERSLENYEADIKLYMFSSSSSGSDGDHGEDDNNEDDDDDDQKKKNKMVFKVNDLGFLPFYKDYLLTDSLRMVGSCNGIICLHDPELMEISKGAGRRHHNSNLRDVYLWNPATGQFRILPKSIPIEEGKYGIEEGSIQEFVTGIQEFFTGFVAFGFDVKTKDYKVLRIAYSIPDWDMVGCMCHVQVYSLSTDSWKLLEDINYLPVVPSQYHLVNHGIYLNGSYFFVGRKQRKFVHGKRDLMMFSFDFTKEIFTTVQFPENENSHGMVLSVMGDKMAVFTRPRIDDTGSDSDGTGSDDSDGTGFEYFDIWVLNEQHSGGDDGDSVVVNKESWTKLHSLRIKTIRGQPYPYYSRPRCISNNGEFALISATTYDLGEKLHLFNLVTQEAEKDFLIDTQVCRADVYKESLVSIMGGGNVLLRWQLSSHGTTYRLNLDTLFIGSRCTLGIGLCLISDTGGCIGVRSLKCKRFVRDAEEGEAQAMLEAIKWAKKLELSPIIIESDSKNVVSFFMDDDDDSTYWSSKALSLLKEAKLLLNSSELGISFQYCSRNCNYVADVAAKLGREGNWFCMDWTANSPGEIARSLSVDLGKET